MVWYGNGVTMIKRFVGILEHATLDGKRPHYFDCERCGKYRTKSALYVDLLNETKMIYLCKACMYTVRNQTMNLYKKPPLIQWA